MFCTLWEEFVQAIMTCEFHNYLHISQNPITTNNNNNIKIEATHLQYR